MGVYTQAREIVVEKARAQAEKIALEAKHQALEAEALMIRAEYLKREAERIKAETERQEALAKRAAREAAQLGALLEENRDRVLSELALFFGANFVRDNIVFALGPNAARPTANGIMVLVGLKPEAWLHNSEGDFAGSPASEDAVLTEVEFSSAEPGAKVLKVLPIFSDLSGFESFPRPERLARSLVARWGEPFEQAYRAQAPGRGVDLEAIDNLEQKRHIAKILEKKRRLIVGAFGPLFGEAFVQLKLMVDSENFTLSSMEHSEGSDRVIATVAVRPKRSDPLTVPALVEVSFFKAPNQPYFASIGFIHILFDALKEHAIGVTKETYPLVLASFWDEGFERWESKRKSNEA